MHLGGARTALVAWLAARKAGGEFLLRVEDLDRPRVIPGAEARILEDLEWLGLGWDGPVVRQSDRVARYRETLDQLIATQRAFPCFCSRAEVARAATAPHGPSDDGPRYPGTCRELSPDEIIERTRTRAPSIRLRVEPNTIAWTDEKLGARSENVSERVGDFVLARADGIIAYQLAVVVDDAAMNITHVVRGEDLSDSTARQIYLFRTLGLSPPAYAHAPLLRGPDGERLSKRHGSISIRDRRAQGQSAASLVGELAAQLQLCEPGSKVTPRELLHRR